MGITDFFINLFSNDTLKGDRKMELTKKDYWELKSMKISTDSILPNIPPFVKNFYISAANCPTCNKKLYKTVFPVGGEYEINTNEGVLNLKRVFTCTDCKVFITAIPGQKVSEGKIFLRKINNGNEYEKLFDKMSEVGGSQGRSDV